MASLRHSSNRNDSVDRTICPTCGGKTADSTTPAILDQFGRPIDSEPDPAADTAQLTREDVERLDNAYRHKSFWKEFGVLAALGKVAIFVTILTGMISLSSYWSQVSEKYAVYDGLSRYAKSALRLPASFQSEFLDLALLKADSGFVLAVEEPVEQSPLLNDSLATNFYSTFAVVAPPNEIDLGTAAILIDIFLTFGERSAKLEKTDPQQLTPRHWSLVSGYYLDAMSIAFDRDDAVDRQKYLGSYIRYQRFIRSHGWYHSLGRDNVLLDTEPNSGCSYLADMSDVYPDY